VTASIVRLLRFASIAICLIVIASFLAFALEQTKTASGQQQEQLDAELPGGGTHAHPGAPSREGTVHKALDEVSRELTSPFAGVVSGASSEWAVRGVKMLLALVVYGFGLGYLARVLRVRV